MTLTGWLLSSGGLFLLPLVLIVEGTPAVVDTPAVAGYLWLATVGGVIAYALWFRGIARLPVTATALLGLLSPLVAALLGALLLGELLTLVQLAGFALALAALVAGQFNPIHSSGNTVKALPAYVGGGRRIGVPTCDAAVPAGDGSCETRRRN